MKAFPRVPLRDIASIRGGKRLAAGELFSTKPTAHPYIRARDIGGGRIEIVDPVFLVEEVARRLRRYTVAHRDVCVTIVGANVGAMGAVPSKLDGANLTENAVRITSNEGYDQTFLKYALLTDDARRQMKIMAGGAAQPKLGIYKIETIEVPCPPLARQFRVASILSAYDDLIENNTLRIAILEEIARRLYEEWFVRLRFPGHAKVEMIKSEMGAVPNEWKIASLSEVSAFINRGLAPKYDDVANGLVINQRCIREQRLSLVEARRQSRAVPDQKLIRRGDVLINSTGVGTLGRLAQVLIDVEDCTADTHVTIVRPGKDCNHDYFGLALLSRQAHFESQGVGSTGQTELARSRIAETKILVPPKELQAQFGNVVGPIRRLAVNLQAKSAILRTSRDLLLPKLVSGELDVSELSEANSAAA